MMWQDTTQKTQEGKKEISSTKPSSTNLVSALEMRSDVPLWEGECGISPLQEITTSAA